jgi:recombination protein RecT
MVLSAISVNPVLAKCTPQSFLGAMMSAAQLGVEPNSALGQAYILPYKNKGVYEAQFQLGYKGYIQLAIRSGMYKKLNVLAIKEGELIRFDPLNEEIEVNLIEDEELREKSETVGYYAMFEYQNGFRKAIYWTQAKMLHHADRFSKAFSAKEYERLMKGEIPEKDMWKYSSFWYTSFDDMAKKTMLRQLLSHWGMLSPEMVQVFEADAHAIRDEGGELVPEIEIEGEEIVPEQPSENENVDLGSL